MKKINKKYFEYIIQTFLIIFSVLFALFLDEYRSNLKTDKELKQILFNVKQEIENNKTINNDMISYHEIVRKNIERVSETDSGIDSLKSDFGFQFHIIAPYGLMRKSVSNSVWQTAKLNPSLNSIDFKKLQVIGSAYSQQQAIFEQVLILTELLRSREMLSNDKTYENLFLLYKEIIELKEKEVELNRIYDNLLKELDLE
ncbi:hypothetical protein ACFLSE_07140 [Bacteroidota bacterium]